MNDHSARCVKPGILTQGSIFKSIQVNPNDPDLALLLNQNLHFCDPSQFFVFANSAVQTARVSDAIQAAGFLEAHVTGCTTAGQLGHTGYEDLDTLILAFPSKSFATVTVEITQGDTQDPQALIDRLVQSRTTLTKEHPDKPNGFAFLLADGLSLQEDTIASVIASAMGPMALFGGSAGDGTRFRATSLFHDIERPNAVGLLTFVVTNCLAEVFSLNHMTPTDQKMVVTRADPAKRKVIEINAEPAAQEYARIVGKSPHELDAMTFASCPIVVQLGDAHHVRSIRNVTEDNALVFFSAVDEGMVLTVASAEPLAPHLSRELSALTEGSLEPEILACDCILRRIEASQTQASRAVSEVLMQHNVRGFSTYGEQIGPLHVNHTMSGVVLSHDPNGT